MVEFESLLRVTLRRSLANSDVSNLPLHFDAAVMDRYRQASGFSIIRTNTVGRIKKEGGWSLDFGIAGEGDSLVHACIGDLQRLPAEDREHWASFATSLPASAMYLQMRMAPGSCFDDGEIRPW
jgi:hypothetical protein